MDCMNTKKTLYRCALIACLGGMRVLEVHMLLYRMWHGKCLNNKRQPVKGRVLNKKEPVLGATIVDKRNTNNGTITDMDGNFSINVKDNSILVLVI